LEDVEQTEWHTMTPFKQTQEIMVYDVTERINKILKCHNIGTFSTEINDIMKN